MNLHSFLPTLLVFLHLMVLVGLCLIGYALYMVWGRAAAIGYVGGMLLAVAVVLIWYLEERT